MDDTEFDRRALRTACQAAGVDPDGDLSPDIDALADEDRPLDEKMRSLRDSISANYDRKKRSG